MLIDREQFLTANSSSSPLTGEVLGEALNPNAAASAYGSSKYDLSNTLGANPAVGEPLAAYIMPTVNAAQASGSITVEVVADDDGAGTDEVSLISKSFTAAQLTTTIGAVKIGVLNTGAITAGNRYLAVKVSAVTANLTAGTFKVWLQKSDTDAYPHNQAVKL